MKKTIKIEDAVIEYEDTQEVRDAVFERVMEYFNEFGCWRGEIIHQSDDPIIYAPNVMSDIADDIIKFEYIYDDED
jgi:hypothetical protein